MGRRDRIVRASLAGLIAACLVEIVWGAARGTADLPAGWLWLPLVLGTTTAVAGWLGWQLRPLSRTGMMLMVVALVLVLGRLVPIGVPWFDRIPWLVGELFVNVAAHTLLAFPGGRIRGRGVRALVALIYLNGIVAFPVIGLLVPPTEVCECTVLVNRNVAVLADGPQWAVGVLMVTTRVTAVLGVAFAVVLWRRWRRGGPASRAILAPVYVSSLVVALAQAAAIVLGAAGLTLPRAASDILTVSLTMAVPLSFLVGLRRTHMTRIAVADLVVSLGSAAGLGAVDLRREVSQRIGDPTLDIAYPEGGQWRDSSGGPVDLTAADAAGSVAVTVVEDRGRPVAALLHDSALEDEAEVLQTAAAAVRLAATNQTLGEELRSRLDDAATLRRRIDRAGDEARRSAERDLHDGAQQRLVGLALAVRLLGNSTDDPDARAALDEAGADIAVALAELRSVARGLRADSGG